ncbi:hypothetical protein C8A05DRAFT_40270 [Staphylotrichum tortipilum]|uniref:Ankyrin repeat protein n=1 Tax=Staphylotrichum tortipilum TaxID=2831512 RepID=A0AAN6MTZ9_9PEZI|nr:hypothetical protein C8A05DRAFT_40270 [Staphylotrichum longicolle]
MASEAAPTLPISIPSLPVPLTGLVKHIDQHPDTPMVELLEPYRQYEAQLRQAFAQNPDNEALKDPHVNVLPLYTEDTHAIKIRARKLESESKEEKSKYIMPLPADIRRPDSSPAIVPSLKDFRHNFGVFSESSLAELNWDNVVAAGSSVVNTLLPVPEEYSRSKRSLREFYHEKFSPASDVDLFLYGLTEEQAIEKIKDIETRVRDALLTETTVVRTKHAITICKPPCCVTAVVACRWSNMSPADKPAHHSGSQYPTRHIQIVLRIYKSVSEILTGFDIDCSGAAYDGKQVYCTPRALQSYITQVNHIDLSRRSPSYENRLSKYSHRGFEVHWPDFDRSRIDPTIFERSFQRTLGLARLLVLERLPTTQARDAYLDKRRSERGRPPLDRYQRNLRSLRGNIKEDYEDEVADWMPEEEVSNYHTFTIPYGIKFNAKRIEKLCYTRDLLLNAEWNQPDDREVYLHRHPAFFGRVEDVVNDCCGYCPVPKTDEEKEVAEEEAKVYVSGKISFIKDDPGRQQIGSFNPLTDDDWTEMAYVGNTARLCQAIVDGDLEHVTDWLAQEGADPNTRDYTGRAPLHLAVMSSTPEIVRALVDAGARLVARLADGRTALHLAAARGEVEIVKILLDKSIANEAEHEEKQDQRRREKKAAQAVEEETQDKVEARENEADDKDADNEDESDGELIDADESEVEAQSITTGLFVKVGKKEADVDSALEDAEEEPDFYDINVISWDKPCSALHFAITEGHTEVVKTLVQEYGADVLLPAKFLNSDKSPYAALLTLGLALTLPVEKAKEMAKTLLSLGATSAQADMNGFTSFHRYVEANAESLLDVLWEMDQAGAKIATDNIAFADSSSCQTPLQLAVQNGNTALVLKLLDHGAVSHIDFEAWLKSAKKSTNMASRLTTLEENQKTYNGMVEQPLILALNSATPENALILLDRGADPNVVTISSQYYMKLMWYSRFTGESALDLANKHLTALGEYKKGTDTNKCPALPEGIDTYLDGFQEGTYQHWAVSEEIEARRKSHRRTLKLYEQAKKSPQRSDGVKEKEAAIAEAIKSMEKVKESLLAHGAKTFVELHPEFADRLESANTRRNYYGYNAPDQKKDEPFTYAFSFRNVIDVTEARKEAYFKLFNAAFNGDLETIKTLTLSSWDDAKEQAPLKIAVHDQNRNNPFSLAFTRGHYDVAKAILEIAQAQYVPEEKAKTRYTMEATDEYSEYSDDSDCSDQESVHSTESRPRIYRQIVDAQFTIENIGEVSMKVNSRTKPLEIINWGSHLRTVISDNDMKGLKFLLDVCERWGTQKSDLDEEGSSFYTFPDKEFTRAVELGRVELLGEIIKRTGAGLPLEHLVKDTGVELQVKPRYYAGLTVYGKKRNDWATAGRNIVRKESGSETSPLLVGALAGRIESVEWFLSDTPSRQYLAFAKSKAARDDDRLKHLAQSPGGFDGAISKWLSDQGELILHAALFAPPTKRATELVSYLVKTQPALVETKAANGVTPLFLACRLGRLDAVKILDQSRNNLLHAVLQQCPGVDVLKEMLELLDRENLIPMLKERNRLEAGGRTPLHDHCTHSAPRHGAWVKEGIAITKTLFDLSPETAQQALKMLDGTGDTPLHSLLGKDADPALVQTVIDFDPTLLCCENAVGRTPVEVAHDRYLADNIKAPTRNRWRPDESVSKLATAVPTDFIKPAPADDEAKEHESKTVMAKNWRMCAEIMARDGQPKRTLVSLNSANFVAKRLGQKHMRDRYRFGAKKDDEDTPESTAGSQDGNSEVGSDEVAAKAEPETAAASADKAKPRRTDIITAKYYGNHSAWLRPKEKKDKKEDDDDESDSNDD